MPSVSKKQRNFMAAAAHNPAFAKKVGISQKVATEFNRADKGKKFGGGGMAKCKKYEEGGLTFAKMDDIDRDAAADAAIQSIVARQAAKSEAAGGMSEKKTTPRRAAPKVSAGSVNENLNDLEMQGVDTGRNASETRRNAQKTGMRHYAGRPPAMKKGGSVRGCGCAIKGKTKGRMV